jgi:hypothetical protein
VELARTDHFVAYSAGQADHRRGPVRWAVYEHGGRLTHSGNARRILVGKGRDFARDVLASVRDAAAEDGALGAPPLVIVAANRVLETSAIGELPALLATLGRQIEMAPESTTIVAIEARH